MPLPKKVKIRDLVGKTVVMDRTVITDECLRVRAGVPMLVAGIGRGLNLASRDGPEAPASYALTGVRRDDVSLPEDPDGPEPYYGALWESRADRGDCLWAECSRCHEITEALRAVRTGTSSTEYTGVEMPFCPCCGARMGVRTPSGKITLGRDLSDRYGLAPKRRICRNRATKTEP